MIPAEGSSFPFSVFQTLIRFFLIFPDKKISKLDTDDLDEIEKITNWSTAAGAGVFPAVEALPLQLDQHLDWHASASPKKDSLRSEYTKITSF